MLSWLRRHRHADTLDSPVWWQVVGLLPALAPSELGELPPLLESALAVWVLIWQGARHAYPRMDPLSLLRRLRFGWVAGVRRDEWRALREARAGSQLGRTVQARQGMVHVVAWPYIHRDWTIGQRTDTVVEHYHQIEQWRWLQVPLGARHVLARLEPESSALSLQIDRPDWFSHEGELVLSLFEGDARLYSVAFSFGRRNGEPVAYVGAIQGRSGEGMSERYASLTRELHGCRPRDLVVLALMFVAEAVQIDQLYAVSDDCRHLRAPRLFRRARYSPSADYDEIWRDRGGVASADGFFVIDTRYAPRPLEEVPARKRAMYRRRYDMLGQLRADLRRRASADRPPVDLLREPAL